MRYLDVSEVEELHQRVVQQSGGHPGIRDPGLLDSAVSQPRMTFSGQELYPSIAEKAAALGFSLISNHPFVDGNKRIGHTAMEAFLVCNGFQIDGSTDEQEALILGVAAGQVGREALTEWLRQHIIPKA